MFFLTSMQANPPLLLQLLHLLADLVTDDSFCFLIQQKLDEPNSRYQVLTNQYCAGAEKQAGQDGEVFG